MTRWNISIPYRSRSDSLTDVMDAARELPPEERGVVRQIVVDLIGEVSNAGELLDRIESASPQQRRELLDRAREREGLKRSAAIDAEPTRHPAGNEGARLQQCHAPDCQNYPLDEAGGWALHAAKRWHCPEHEHLAADGDMAPAPQRYAVVGPYNQLVAVGEEKARLDREEAERKERQRERDRQREAEAEAIRRAKERYADDDAAVQNVMDLRVRPDGRIVND